MATKWAGVAAAVAGGGIVWYRLASLPVDPSAPLKTFTGMTGGWVDLKLVDSQQLNHNVKCLRFSLPDPAQVAGLPIGSAVLGKHIKEGDWFPTLRPYTPTSSQKDKGYLEFVVKHYPNGPVSSHIYEFQAGDKFAVRGPLPTYEWKSNKHHHVGLLAGGAGVTPCYQLARKILSNPNDKTKITLLFANSTEEDIFLFEELRDLEKTSKGQLKVHFIVSRPTEAWTGYRGRITRKVLEETLPGPAESNIKLFLCGPEGFHKALSGAKPNPVFQGSLSGVLKEMGYTKDQVYKF